MANSNSNSPGTIALDSGIRHPQGVISALAEAVSDDVKRALCTDSEESSGQHLLLRTRLHERLVSHFSRFDISLTFGPADGEIRAGDISISAYWSHLVVRGKKESLQAIGFSPAWFPGAPGQKKTVGRASATFFGVERQIKLRADGARNLFAFVDAADDELDELRKVRKAATEAAECQDRLAIARRKSSEQIAALPATSRQFSQRYIEPIDLIANSVISRLSCGQGGYAVEQDDLDGFRLAMRDALNVLRCASICFDQCKREAEILQIIDKNIDAAMPTSRQPEVRHV